MRLAEAGTLHFFEMKLYTIAHRWRGRSVVWKRKKAKEMAGGKSMVQLLRRAAGLVSLMGLIFFAGFVFPANAFETQAREALLLDVSTGTTLFEKNADQLMPPASMSKMMTTYMVFDELKKDELKLDDTFTVSSNAWEKGGAASGGSTMFLNPGEVVKLEDLIRGIVVQSGNDACIVVAEGLAGSEEAFAERMTKKGKEIGLLNTTFTNATGLPDPRHITTARDLATLAYRTIEDSPEHYHYYAEKEFTHNEIRQGNRNPLLYKDMGADGLKTGHTNEAGYGLTASAKQGDRRLILVLNGLPSMKSRVKESERIMLWGFREFDTYTLFEPGEQVSEAEVWLGTEKTVPLFTPEGLRVTLSRQGRADMQVKVGYDGPIRAPIVEGDTIATLTITVPDISPIEVPLAAGASVDEMGFVGKIAVAVKQFVAGATD
jgi:D-alanyl-D-alanine carboxypeptidase (penicillin-binding protein 5/6)